MIVLDTELHGSLDRKSIINVLLVRNFVLLFHPLFVHYTLDYQDRNVLLYFAWVYFLILAAVPCPCP